MNAPLVEFLRRFRERERENAAQDEISLPYPIILREQARATPGASAAEARASSRRGRPIPR